MHKHRSHFFCKQLDTPLPNQTTAKFHLNKMNISFMREVKSQLVNIIPIALSWTFAPGSPDPPILWHTHIRSMECIFPAVWNAYLMRCSRVWCVAVSKLYKWSPTTHGENHISVNEKVSIENGIAEICVVVVSRDAAADHLIWAKFSAIRTNHHKFSPQGL